MERSRPWLAAANPAQALIPLLAVEVGAAAARFDARPRAGLLAHALVDLAAVAAALAIHLVDHAWDAPAAPPPDPKRPIPEKDRPLAAREAFLAAAIALGAAAVCGLGLAFVSGAAALGYGLAAVLLGVWRRVPEVGADALGFGLGEIATVIALGPCAVAAGYAAQAGEGGAGALYAGVPVGLVAAAAAFVRHYTRHPADVALSRVTPVVSLGEGGAGWIAVLSGPLAAAGILFALSAGVYPRLSWVACLPLLAAAGFAAWGLRDGAPPVAVARVERATLAAVAVALAALALTLRTAS